MVDANKTDGKGGGIYVNLGTLTLEATAVSNNQTTSPGSLGGGIYNSAGTVTIKSGSKITFNISTSGGGIYNSALSQMSIDDASINDNAAFDGAGISNFSRERLGALDIANSTFSSNTATNKGGAIYQNGNMTIINSSGVGNKAKKGAGIEEGPQGKTTDKNTTITRNTAVGDGINPGLGGGVYLEAGAELDLVNSIIAGNTADFNPDVNGLVVSSGYNLIGDGTSSSGWLSADLVGTSSSPIDPKLTALGDYGGPTQTLLLQPSSPALAAGDPMQVTSVTDQRGYARIVNGSVDIGAVEMQTAAVATSTSLSSSLNPSQNGQAVTFTTVVTASGGTPTGTVTFFDGSRPLDTETLNVSGGASFTTSALTVDNHPITALYSGNGTFAGGTSAVLTQQVNPALTTVYLSSSLNPAPFGQNVTFMASVAPSYAGTPTGTVSYYDGATLLATVTIDISGNAYFTTSALAVGNHSITAVYSGDSVFTGSTSNVLTQSVV